MASNVTPSTPGAPLFFLASAVGFVERLPLADVDVQAPETPGRFGLRLDVDPPPQVLQIDGRLYHLAPASRVGEGITNSRAPSLRGRYPASTLLRAPPPPSRLRPTSRGRRLYGLPGSAAFAAGRGGLLQLLDVSLSPCRRYHPAGASRRVSRRCDGPCCLRPPVAGSASGASHFRGHLCVHLRYGPVTRRPSRGWPLSMGFRTFGFPPACHPSYGASALTPAGLTPAEHPAFAGRTVVGVDDRREQAPA